jgi:hypothetical protein
MDLHIYVNLFTGYLSQSAHLHTSNQQSTFTHVGTRNFTDGGPVEKYLVKDKFVLSKRSSFPRPLNRQNCFLFFNGRQEFPELFTTRADWFRGINCRATC